MAEEGAGNGWGFDRERETAELAVVDGERLGGVGQE
jgi:hypothetical protein